MKALAKALRKNLRFIDTEAVLKRPVVNLMAFRLAIRIYWANAAAGADVPFEVVYDGILDLLNDEQEKRSEAS